MKSGQHRVPGAETPKPKKRFPSDYVNVEGPTIPFEVAAGERPIYSFKQMSDNGILWLINRVVFHPRGLALCLEFAKGEKEPRGWSILGFNEPVVFNLPDNFERNRYEIIERLFVEAKRLGRMPQT